MRGAAELATINAALARAREITSRRLDRARKPAAWYRRMLAGKIKARKPHIPRAQRTPHTWLRDEVDERRRLMAETPLQVPWSAETQAYFDALYDKTETLLQRERRHAGVRELTAAKCREAAAYLREHPSPAPPVGSKKPQPLQHNDCADFSDRLLRARRHGHWGTHTEEGTHHIRFFDRSGLPLLDPSEARRNAARIGRRLVPMLQRCHKAGLLLYYAVASEPNVPAGRLQWGKRNLFRRLRRDIYENFPEIVGLVAVQEDPLSADLQTWNVHLNLILVVDPKLCTPLTEEVAQQLDLKLRGHSILRLPLPPPPPDPTPPGLLSFAKVHRAWGSHQFHVEKLKSCDDESLGRTLREIIKYTVKMVSEKRLSDVCGPGHDRQDSAGSDRAADRDPDAGPLGVGGVGHPARIDGGQPFTLGEGDSQAASRRAPSRTPPCLTAYPPGRFVEFLEANRRFRRVRTWGLLYRLDPDDRPPDPDAASLIRWHGRIAVSPRHVFVEAARLSFVSSTHGDKSAAWNRAGTGQRARAGPGPPPPAAWEV